MDKIWMSENVWFSHHTYATVLEHAYVRWAEFIELSDCGGDAAAAAADGMYVVHKAAYRMNSDRTIVRLRCAFNQKFSISILDFLRWWIHSSNMLESPLSFQGWNIPSWNEPYGVLLIGQSHFLAGMKQKEPLGQSQQERSAPIIPLHQHRNGTWIDCFGHRQIVVVRDTAELTHIPAYSVSTLL